MQEFKIYKLHFTTPLHLGDERLDYGKSLRTIHSDTMYAALVSVLAKIGREISDKADLGFTISSLFPFYQKDKEIDSICFLPKLLKHNLPHNKHQDIAKSIKKIKWLDKDYFQKQILGNEIFDKDFNPENIKGEYLTAKDIPEDGFIKSEVFPRVTVSRTGKEDAIPFYMERLFFKDYSGMFFIALGDTKLLDIALEILKEEGIGTDRNIGNGFFEFDKNNDIQTIKFDLPESNYKCNLSMYLPESQEELSSVLNSKNIAYDFIKRGGWITTPPYGTFRKNSVNMFTEASVFSSVKTNNITICGKIANLTPQVEHIDFEHKIFRNGKAIFIPVKI